MSALERLPAWLARCARFAQALWEQSRRDHVFIRASGLAYASLLATVPLVAVVFALFSAFGVFDELKESVQEFLFSQFLPTRQDEIVAYVNAFTENTDKLGLLGSVFLLVTSILLLDSIETNFNDIWHARSRRRLLNKITAYTSVLVFGMIFMGASLSISATLKARLFRGSILDRSFITRIADWSLPLLLTLIGFLVIYMVIPNARVRLASAATGALVGGVLWELGKNVFASSVGKWVSYSTIYGSLATIPIFLVWLYVTWLIVLLGLEVAFTHQHFHTLERELKRRGAPRENPLVLAMKLYLLLARRFHRGGSPPTTDRLAEATAAKRDEVENCLGRLADAGLARRLGARVEDGWVPGRPLDQVLAVDLVRLFLIEPEISGEGEEALERVVEDLLRKVCRGGEEALAGASIKDLVELSSTPAAVAAS